MQQPKANCLHRQNHCFQRASITGIAKLSSSTIMAIANVILVKPRWHNSQLNAFSQFNKKYVASICN